MFVYGIDLLMTNNLFEISYYYFMGSGLIARGKPLLYLCIISFILTLIPTILLFKKVMYTAEIER